MRDLRPRLADASLAAGPVVGAGLTLVAAYLAVRTGAQISVGLLLVVTFFVGTVIAFIAYPHLAVAATIPLFAFVPALKALVWSEIGPLKDFVVLAAVAAALILYLFNRRRPDGWVLTLVLLLLGLYVINPGGAHNLAWAQGVRLIGEPLLLLLVGLTLPQPQRTFRFAMAALVITTCLVAAYGILQQIVGPETLASWGYSFESQIRIAYGHLRSFGTLDRGIRLCLAACIRHCRRLLLGAAWTARLGGRSPFAGGAGSVVSPHIHPVPRRLGRTGPLALGKRRAPPCSSRSRR